jgi:hypothetical protein
VQNRFPAEMSCDNCSTYVRYGKRVKAGRRLCIDCWKDERPSSNEKSDGKNEESQSTDDD